MSRILLKLYTGIYIHPLSPPLPPPQKKKNCLFFFALLNTTTMKYVADIFQEHHWVWHAIALRFRSCAFHRRTRYSCIYIAPMSSTFNRISALLVPHARNCYIHVTRISIHNLFTVNHTLVNDRIIQAMETNWTQETMLEWFLFFRYRTWNNDLSAITSPAILPTSN